MSLLWNGDFSTGDLTQWGGVEYVGTNKSGWSVTDRVTVATAVDGFKPPSGLTHLCRLRVVPNDQYFSTTGWRTLMRTHEPIKMLSAGYDSWFVFAILLPAGYPADAKMWVAPIEVHQTKASYVSVTGVAPMHLIATGSSFGLDVAGGRDGSRTVAINQQVASGYTKGKWQVFVMRYKHSYDTSGAFELYYAEEGSESLVPVVSKTGIKTMYEGTQNYFEWGIYRAQSGSSETKVYLAGVREYSTKDEAMNYAGTLLGLSGSNPTPSSTTATTNITNGQQIVGTYDWIVNVTGPGDQVEFFVNNTSIGKVAVASGKATFHLDPLKQVDVAHGGYHVLTGGSVVYASPSIAFTLIPDYAAMAEKELRSTTITYGDWKHRVDSGFYAAKSINPATGTSWGRAFAYLAKL